MYRNDSFTLRCNALGETDRPCGSRSPIRPSAILTLVVAGLLPAFPARTARADQSCREKGAEYTEALAGLEQEANTSPPTAAESELHRLFTFTWKEGLGGDYVPRLEKHGVRVNAFINNQFQSVLKGGLDTNGSGRSAASMDAFITVDLHKLGLIENADALLHIQSNWGRGINDRVGSLTEVNDDADGSLGLHVAQLWYRQHFVDRKVALTFGFLDFQTIVDRNAFANSEDKQFWNQALDNNPLVPLSIGLGATVEVQPKPWWTVIVGAADAQSVLYKPGFSTAFHDESWFIAYAENTLRLLWPTARGNLIGNYRLGAVFDPRPRTAFTRSELDDAQRGDNYGVYVSIDQKLFREGTADEQGLGVFARAGARSSETFRFPEFWSGGLSYTGLLPRRDRDVAGFGVAYQRSSHVYRDRVDRAVDDETVYELFYAVQVTDWLVVTPDVQYIDNPGGDEDIGQAIVAGIRVRASF